MVFITTEEILETVRMIQDENLDVRAVTMGISLSDCASRDVGRVCERVHDKILATAGRLVPAALEIQEKYGVPIVNRRVSVTPIADVVAAGDAGGLRRRRSRPRRGRRRDRHRLRGRLLGPRAEGRHARTTPP